ncbi:DUF3298 and DUF4163 domain-containing protein [Bacillus paralicheniformis]|uniref:DUF3298 and DUF4163 domain-containing protein n=1 Tax=Bacillus paralicheniformis TaxID=1648923 RepID=UPI00128B6342|nr:DUF3298 and DUF4163 domain-containing protein [Bacillus paralicheniformis]MPQ25136.1 DUF3298 domain-containing protein [Bacillus paralicheniformis]
MDKKLETLRNEYKNTPIPDELDFVLKKALKQKKKKHVNMKRSLVGVGAAAIILIIGINTSPAFAKTLSEVPFVGSLVKVVTFTEYKMNEKTYNAEIEVPAIENLDNESLQSTLNEKYLEESKALFEEFQTEVESLKEIQDGGHLGVDSGYEIKTDTEQILSIGRYVVNTVGSSSTTFQFDTIDKKNELLITLPSLFKNEEYIDVISEEIKKQMISQMEQDSSLYYWVKNPNKKDESPFDPFEKIKPEQSFYINKNNKLVIVFNKYEVAPGYMGVVEFTIPSGVLSNVLVSNEYIK